jgi:hypothetical protein
VIPIVDEDVAPGVGSALAHALAIVNGILRLITLAVESFFHPNPGNRVESSPLAGTSVDVLFGAFRGGATFLDGAERALSLVQATFFWE